MGVIVLGILLVFAFVEGEALKQRKGFFVVLKLVIGIAHVELQLLRLHLCQRSCGHLFVEGESLDVFPFVEKHVGVEEVGVVGPGAARVVGDEGLDFGFGVAATRIERTDGEIILGIDRFLLFGVVDGGEVLAERLDGGAVFAILEENQALAVKGFGFILGNRFLCLQQGTHAQQHHGEYESTYSHGGQNY